MKHMNTGETRNAPCVAECMHSSEGFAVSRLLCIGFFVKGRRSTSLMKAGESAGL